MITDLALSGGLYHAPAFFADENELEEFWTQPKKLSQTTRAKAIRPSFYETYYVRV